VKVPALALVESHAAWPVWAEQIENNQSALGHFEAFSHHRERWTKLVLDAAPEDGQGRLCILGAGNSYDLDLERLGAAYSEVHLVDLDAAALERTQKRLGKPQGFELFLHAPIDLSGLFVDIDRWKGMQLAAEDVMRLPGHTAQTLAQLLPTPFDVVASSCVLSQMQLGLLQTLGEPHPLFQAARYTLNVTHLRTLAELGKRALLATDVVQTQELDMTRVDPRGDLRPLLAEQLARGNVMYATQPALLRAIVSDDPILGRAIELSEPLDAWLWQNGPDTSFIVYALELSQRAPPH
jgi:hypothetical protein